MALNTLLCMILGCSAVNTTEVSYQFYHGSVDQGTEISQNNPEELIKYNDLTKCTVLFVHGWKESCQNNSAVEISSALLARGDCNVYCVDWSPLANQNLIVAAKSLQIISDILAADLNRMFELGLILEETWIIGFSLGAHIAGQAGANLISKGNGKLGRITALDAAMPMMYNPPCYCHTLEKSDAITVDVIHTDAGIFGVDQPIGHFDIYINGGRRLQKGCPLLPSSLDLTGILPTYRCSHDRSWIQFAEAIRNPSSYIARKCDSYGSFLAGRCAQNTLLILGGYLPDKNAAGTYHITTNAQTPFGRGIAGASP